MIYSQQFLITRLEEQHLVPGMQDRLERESKQQNEISHRIQSICLSSYQGLMDLAFRHRIRILHFLRQH